MALVVCLFGATVPVFAGHYPIETYRSDSGLPQAQVLSICQLFSSEPRLNRARRTIAMMDALRVRHGTKQRCSRTVCALALR